MDGLELARQKDLARELNGGEMTPVNSGVIQTNISAESQESRLDQFELYRHTYWLSSESFSTVYNLPFFHT